MNFEAIHVLPPPKKYTLYYGQIRNVFFFLGFVSGKLNFLGEKSVHAKEVVPTTDPPGVT